MHTVGVGGVTGEVRGRWEHADEGYYKRIDLLCIAANGSCLQWISIGKVGLEGPGTIWRVLKMPPDAPLQSATKTTVRPWQHRGERLPVPFKERNFFFFARLIKKKTLIIWQGDKRLYLIGY